MNVLTAAPSKGHAASESSSSNLSAAVVLDMHKTALSTPNRVIEYHILIERAIRNKRIGEERFSVVSRDGPFGVTLTKTLYTAYLLERGVKLQIAFFKNATGFWEVYPGINAALKWPSGGNDVRDDFGDIILSNAAISQTGYKVVSESVIREQIDGEDCWGLRMKRSSNHSILSTGDDNIHIIYISVANHLIKRHVVLSAAGKWIMQLTAKSMQLILDSNDYDFDVPMGYRLFMPKDKGAENAVRADLSRELFPRPPKSKGTENSLHE